MFQYRVWHNDLVGGLGLALAHPLYHLIGMFAKIIPFGEFGYRVNVVSAICGAITVANVFLLLRVSMGGVFSAVIGAVSLGLSWTFWQHSAIAEVYTLYTAIFSAELVCLFLYFKKQKVGFLYATAFLNGLSIANHMWGILPLACCLVMAGWLVYRKDVKVGQVLLMAVFWMVGCLPYEVLIVRELMASGDLVATMRSALFGDKYGSAVLNSALTGTIIKQNFMFFGLNFPTPNALLFFGGLFGCYKLFGNKIFVNVLLAILAIFFVFAFRYTVPDRYAFFMPFYCVAGVFIGVGCQRFIERFQKKYVLYLIAAFSLLPVAVYAVVPVLAERAEVNLGTKRQIPYRNEYTYFLRPWQCSNNGPELFAEAAFNSVEDGSVIIADGTTVYALWYGQEVLGFGKGVKVISEHGDYDNPMDFVTPETLNELLGEKSVYVVSPQKGYCPGFILDNYDFVESGPVFRVKRKVKVRGKSEYPISNTE